MRPATGAVLPPVTPRSHPTAFLMVSCPTESYRSPDHQDGKQWNIFLNKKNYHCSVDHVFEVDASVAAFNQAVGRTARHLQLVVSWSAPGCLVCGLTGVIKPVFSLSVVGWSVWIDDVSC